MFNFDLVKILFLILSAYYIYCFFKVLYFYSYTIKKWKPTICKILDISVLQHEEFTNDDTGWKNEIKYSYFVDGVSYESNYTTKNLRILLPFSEWVHEKYLGFMVNDELEIKYNPQNPKESMFDTKFGFYNIFYLIIAFIILIVFVF